MSFENYEQYTSPTETISAGDSTLLFVYHFAPPGGKVFVNAGWDVSPVNGYEDETYFVPIRAWIRHTGGDFYLTLRRCGPIPKQDYMVRTTAQVATIG